MGKRKKRFYSERISSLRSAGVGMRREHKRGFRRGLFVGFLAGVMMQCVVGCAHEPRKGSWVDCRSRCEEYRGSTWTFWGGPTVPSGKHQDCMDGCRTSRN